MRNSIILILTCLPFCVLAQDPNYHELNGSFLIWGNHLSGGDKEDLDGISFFIKGGAAEELYKKMKVDPIYNECFNDGTVTKFQGMFECSLTKEGAYGCSFGISTKEGKVYGAESC